MKMSLEKWVEYGWLKREPTSPGEIKEAAELKDSTLAWLRRAHPDLIKA
jgi:hypothetical protein